MTTTVAYPPSVSNVLSDEKRQQVIALGRLGWPLRRIEKETGVRRETAGAYLKTAGVAIRPAGGWGSPSAGKTGQRGVPRLHTVFKTGQWGVPRF